MQDLFQNYMDDVNKLREAFHSELTATAEEPTKAMGLNESWARESGQVDKWIFCLTTARLAEDQEIR